jgi:hypothetical protein
MRICRNSFPLVLAVVLAFAVPIAKADTIYTYTGNDFTRGVVSGGGNDPLPISGNPYTTSDFVSGTVTLDSALPYNDRTLTDYSSNVTAVDLTDGLGTINTLSNSNDEFYFDTTNGVVTQWAVEVYNSAGTYGIGTVWAESNAEDYGEECPTQCSGTNYSAIGLAVTPGTWESAPEPSTISIASLGLILCAGAIQFKRKRQSLRS